MIKHLMLPLVVFSLTACAIARPNTDVCIVNAPNANRKCYNLATDYNDDGTLKATAKPVYRPNSVISDLNKVLVIDSPSGFQDGLAELKSYIKKLRDHYASCRSGN